MSAKSMKAIALVISCVLVVLAAVQIAFTALMVLAELQDRKCPTSVEMSDLDFVREAWNAELAALSQPIATIDEAAQLIRSNPDCCRVIHVGPRSLWTKLTSVTEGRAEVIVYLTFRKPETSGNSTARVEFDACGNLAYAGD